MDYTKQFTKIILAAMGIYFLIRVVPQVAFSIYFNFTNPGRESFLAFFINLIIAAFCILLIWYFFFYLRAWCVERITSKITPAQADEQTPWFPSALRLVCIFTGLYFLLSSVFQLTIQINLFLNYLKNSGNSTKSFLSGGNEVIIFQLIFYLVAGTYLIFGAPHFVRWQVKKTIQQCKELEKLEILEEK